MKGELWCRTMIAEAISEFLLGSLLEASRVQQGGRIPWLMESGRAIRSCRNI
jgi:hypothetical protein